MLFLKTRGLVLGFVIALLWPATAFAQVPAAPPAASAPQVQIKVDFVTIGSADLTADLARSGLTSDRVPFTPPDGKPFQAEQFLRYATGDAAVRLFQMLARTGGKSVQVPLITTPNNVTATVNAQLPDRQSNSLTLQAGLSVTPRVNSDGSISLNLAAQIADINTRGQRAPILRTVQNGAMMVLAGLPLSRDKHTSDQDLVIFVTPTIVGTDAKKAETGLPDRSLPDGLVCRVFHEQKFSLDISASNLRAVVTMLERQADIKALVQDSDSAYKPVYVHIADVLLAKTLQAIAASAGAQVSRNAEGVYIFSPLPGAVLTPMPKAPVGGGGESVTVTP